MYMHIDKKTNLCEANDQNITSDFHKSIWSNILREIVLLFCIHFVASPRTNTLECCERVDIGIILLSTWTIHKLYPKIDDMWYLIFSQSTIIKMFVIDWAILLMRKRNLFCFCSALLIISQLKKTYFLIKHKVSQIYWVKIIYKMFCV